MAWRESNAQRIKKSKRSDFQLRRSIEARSKDANQRLSRLIEKGYGRDQFVQEHKGGFHFFEGMTTDEKFEVKRIDLSKELARIDRFLNAKSSRITGIKESRQATIKALNDNDKIGFEITEENYDDFQDLMNEYRNKYKNQVRNIQSDKVINELWRFHEEFKISAQELKENMVEFVEHIHEIENTSMEDIKEFYERINEGEDYEFDPEEFSLTDYFREKNRWEWNYD